MKNIADILKSFSIKQRLTVLVLLLLASLISTLIKSYYTHSDCEPMQKQVQELVTTQEIIMKQNHIILDKDRELTDDIIKLRGIISNMKPDTVFITIKPETVPISNTSIKNDEHLEMSNVAFKFKIENANKKETKFKSGNSKSILKEMDKIIEKTKN